MSYAPGPKGFAILQHCASGATFKAEGRGEQRRCLILHDYGYLVRHPSDWSAYTISARGHALLTDLAARRSVEAA